MYNLPSCPYILPSSNHNFLIEITNGVKLVFSENEFYFFLELY